MSIIITTKDTQPRSSLTEIHFKRDKEAQNTEKEHGLFLFCEDFNLRQLLRSISESEADEFSMAKGRSVRLGTGKYTITNSGDNSQTLGSRIGSVFEKWNELKHVLTDHCIPLEQNSSLHV